MEHASYSDAYIRKILENTRNIAMVGASNKSDRPSYVVMKYMQAKGYRVIPVNPRLVGKDILGERVHASLSEIIIPIDMVDIFRNSDAAGPVTDDAIAANAHSVWMQIGVRNDDAAVRAEAAGLMVVMNRCPKIEFSRLGIEIKGVKIKGVEIDRLGEA